MLVVGCCVLHFCCAFKTHDTSHHIPSEQQYISSLQISYSHPDFPPKPVNGSTGVGSLEGILVGYGVGSLDGISVGYGVDSGVGVNVLVLND